MRSWCGASTAPSAGTQEYRMVSRPQNIAQRLRHSRTQIADRLVGTLGRFGEPLFRQPGVPRSLTQWRSSSTDELASQLSESLLERAIGVIYRPETELTSHYFESVLAEQFDAFVWFEETTAVTPLPAGHAEGLPDTYPFGV